MPETRSALQRKAARETLLFDRRMQLCRQLFGQSPEPLHLLEGGAELLLVDDLLQRFDPLVESHLLVLFKEEAGVREPGPQYPFIPLDNHGGIFGEGIVDGDKAVEEPAVGVEHGEVALVAAAWRLSAPLSGL